MFWFRKKHDSRSAKEESVAEERKTEDGDEATEVAEKDVPETKQYSVEAVGKIIKFVLGDRYDGFQLKDKTQWFKRKFIPYKMDFAVYLLSDEIVNLRIAVETYHDRPCTGLKFDVVDSLTRDSIIYDVDYSSIDCRMSLRLFSGNEAKFVVRSLETLPDDLIVVMEDGPYKDEGGVVDGYEQHGNIERSIRWKGRCLLDKPLDVKEADRIIENLKSKKTQG